MTARVLFLGILLLITFSLSIGANVNDLYEPFATPPLSDFTYNCNSFPKLGSRDNPKVSINTDTTDNKAFGDDFGSVGSIGKPNSCTGCGKNFGRHYKIKGGEVTSKGQWPWQVALEYENEELLCGGTLIASNWVLTAAQCVCYVELSHAILGDHHRNNNNKNEIKMKVIPFVHSQYDPDTGGHDIALLKLSQPVNCDSYISPACLPTLNQPTPMHDDCFSSGWGRNRHGQLTDQLQHAQVPIVNLTRCKDVFDDVKDNHICAGYRDGRADICRGDSGGPLVCNHGNNPWTVFGISIGGAYCNTPQSTYSVYTNVAMYMDDIKWLMEKKP